tara:strand:- start:345 stop:503 length:159 start_codon:yes stop_codon:yes gene_type:complete
MTAPIVEAIFQFVAPPHLGEFVSDAQQVNPCHQIDLVLELGFRRWRLLGNSR